MSKTRAAWSSAVAALLALLLLFGSSLGQIAHFFAIQHAICAEHGEVVELHDEHGHGGDETPGQPQDTEDEHDHCQELARAQRELAMLAAPALGIAPAAPLSVVSLSETRRAGATRQPLLALAPKTSPPRHAVG